MPLTGLPARRLRELSARDETDLNHAEWTLLRHLRAHEATDGRDLSALRSRLRLPTHTDQ